MLVSDSRGIHFIAGLLDDGLGIQLVTCQVGFLADIEQQS
jgi:hypothetical protein